MGPVCAQGPSHMSLTWGLPGPALPGQVTPDPREEGCPCSPGGGGVLDQMWGIGGPAQSPSLCVAHQDPRARDKTVAKRNI